MNRQHSNFKTKKGDKDFCGTKMKKYKQVLVKKCVIFLIFFLAAFDLVNLAGFGQN